MKLTAFFISICLSLACQKKTGPNSIDLPQINSDMSLTYLALGDSYTIGESVSAKDSFPFQLAANLSSNGLTTITPKIVAKTGWTTGELQNAIKQEQGLSAKYDIVTLLIGVNNQYRGNSIAVYRKEFKELLQTALTFAGGTKTHVYVVSIPDWGVTPFARSSGRDLKNITKEIDEFNAVNREESTAAGVSYIDITPGSRAAETDRSLIADDGLHPSGKMYANWASAIAPIVLKNFR